MNKNQIFFIISLIFAILVTVFALTNAGPVPVNLFFYKVEASQALIIFMSAAIGAIITLLLGIWKYYALVIEGKKMKKNNENLQNEIKRLLSELEKFKSLNNDKVNVENIDNKIER